MPEGTTAAAMGPDRQAGEVADRFWDRLLELEPVVGTQVGDHRFDGRLPDPSEEGVARRAEVFRGALSELAAIDRGALGEDARTTLDVLEALCSAGLEDVAFRLDRFRAVSHLFGPASLLAELGSLQRADTPERAAAYVERLRAIPAYLEGVGEAARGGLAAGMTAPSLVVDRAIAQVRRLLATDPQDSPGMTPLPDAAPERELVVEVLRERVWPAFEGYLSLLEGYRPHARDTVGLCALPDGDAMYAGQIHAHTTLHLDAAAVHETGLQELARVRDEAGEIAARLGYRDPDAALAAHTESGRNTAASPEELLRLAERQVQRSWEAAPAYFGRLPAAPCEVRPVEKFREQDMPPAFYYSPAADGSRPGVYYINLSDLAHRPLHLLAAMSYHEANPGHHFQLSIEQEFTTRPALRRFGATVGGTAFAEGWGLYCERLADEMGLYDNDYERLGMLTAQAWRAARLVVDTGLHALGWERAHAVEVVAGAGIPQGTAEVEVDRYILWPGQALAYKIGQIELQRLRSEAEQAGFSLRAFHDRLLELGTLPLPSLRRELAR